MFFPDKSRKRYGLQNPCSTGYIKEKYHVLLYVEFVTI